MVVFERIEHVWARFRAALVQAMAQLHEKSLFPRQRGYLLLVLGDLLLTPHQNPDGRKVGTQTDTASAGAGFSFLSRVGGYCSRTYPYGLKAPPMGRSHEYSLEQGWGGQRGLALGAVAYFGV